MKNNKNNNNNNRISLNFGTNNHIYCLIETVTNLPLMKKVILSSTSHSERRKGCTLVVNLNPDFSFINTTPAGTAALIGETILHIPDICLKVSEKDKQKELAHPSSHITKHIDKMNKFI